MAVHVFPAPHRDRPERDAALTRVRRGVYAGAASMAAAAAEERYLARIHAVALSRREPVFALESALALHGLPFGVEPEHVATIGDRTTAGRRAGVAHTHAEIAPEDITILNGLRVCSVAYALADIARRRTQLVAVAAMDAALRSGSADRPAVLAACGRQGPRGRRRATWVVSFADARSESVGESYSRVVMHRLGVPPPTLQAVVPTAFGARRVDFRWDRPGRRPLAGEFDGFVKYEADAPLAVFREKQREDAIRASHDMARWVWADVLEPGRLARVLGAAGLPLGPRLLPGW